MSENCGGGAMIIWCQWTLRKASCCVLKALPKYLCPIIPSKPLNRLRFGPLCYWLFNLDTTREEKNWKNLECIPSTKTKPLQGKFCNQEKCICLLRRANCQLWRGLVETIKGRFNFTWKCSTKSNGLDIQDQQQRPLIQGKTSESQHLATDSISRTSCRVIICKNVIGKSWYRLAKPCHSRWGGNPESPSH